MQRNATQDIKLFTCCFKMTYCSSRVCIWFYVYVTLVVRTPAANEDRYLREIPNNQQHYRNDAFKGKNKIILPTTIPEDILHRKKECHMGCIGPVAQYRSLNCTPVFYADHCCPVRYECPPKDSNICYVNGKMYNIGERIRQEDAILCEEDCICQKEGNRPADFQCPKREEMCPPYLPTRDGCYQRNSLEQCCPTEEICPEEPRDVRPVCIVDGGVVLDGQYVLLRYVPELICICQANNTDIAEAKLVCVETKRWFWSDIHAAIGFFNDCAPVYLPHKQRIIGVTRVSWRCPKATDRVYCTMNVSPVESERLHRPDTPVPYFYEHACDTDQADWQEWYLSLIESSGFPFSYRCQFLLWYKRQCIFGHLRLHIGDRLSAIKFGDGSCILCFCEIPPILTCVYQACNNGMAW